jgi:hypothetical protein
LIFDVLKLIGQLYQMKAPLISFEENSNTQETNDFLELKDAIYKEDVNVLEKLFSKKIFNLDESYDRPIGCVLYSKVYSDVDLNSLSEEDPSSPVVQFYFILK